VIPYRKKDNTPRPFRITTKHPWKCPMRDFRLCKGYLQIDKKYILKVFCFYMAKILFLFLQNLAIVPHDQFSLERRTVKQKIYV
jgi:hypothetical protein